MEEDFLKYKNSKIHFVRFGNGEKLLIALHGFADQATIFVSLKESLEKEYTVYCLDLPFHGMTTWDGLYFKPSDVSALFKLILEKEKKERFDLMGFSLGGRIVQKMLFDWLPKIDRIFLIAPDGLKTKWMFNSTMIPAWFQSLLKRMLQNPAWFIATIKKLYQWGIVNKFIHYFVCYHINTALKRDRIFSTWNSLNYFRLQPRKVKKLLQSSSVRVDMYFGNRDKIIPVSAGKLLSEGLENVHLHILEEGHLLVGADLNELLKRHL